jgi:L-ascorbate metabolism protein UlaG (beta-lactamase superfamily)
LLVTWYGTAGFRIETGGRVMLIDPYLSRNKEARPALPFGSEGVTEANEIFLSHGHFDHAVDVPGIARRTGAEVYCSAEAAEALHRQGVTDAQLVVARDGDAFDFGVYRAQCFHSAHVRFDLPLVVRTLLRALPSILAKPRLLSGPRDWPPGQVLSWRLTLAAEDDRVVHHFGSAGCTEDELARLTNLGAPDVLMFPLQGHSRICQIAAHVVERLRPRVVIPHHHDDFYPPISQAVAIGLFVEAAGSFSPPVEVVELPVCEAVEV